MSNLPARGSLIFFKLLVVLLGGPYLVTGPAMNPNRLMSTLGFSEKGVKENGQEKGSGEWRVAGLLVHGS